jgi:hypothetical protein
MKNFLYDNDADGQVKGYVSEVRKQMSEVRGLRVDNGKPATHFQGHQIIHSVF